MAKRSPVPHSHAGEPTAGKAGALIRISASIAGRSVLQGALRFGRSVIHISLGMRFCFGLSVSLSMVLIAMEPA